MVSLADSVWYLYDFRKELSFKLVRLERGEYLDLMNLDKMSVIGPANKHLVLPDIVKILKETTTIHHLPKEILNEDDCLSLFSQVVEKYPSMRKSLTLNQVERTVRIIGQSEAQEVRGYLTELICLIKQREYPIEWTYKAMMVCDESLFVKRFKLSCFSPEYCTVEQTFKQTVKKTVVSVERIQNKFLWDRFVNHRKQLRATTSD